MQLNEVFKLSEYAKGYEFARANGFLIEEIKQSDDSERLFKIVRKPEKTEEEILNELRSLREVECFSVINRGSLWYENLCVEEYVQLKEWYQKWLDVTQSKVVPDKPVWIK